MFGNTVYGDDTPMSPDLSDVGQPEAELYSSSDPDLGGSPTTQINKEEQKLDYESIANTMRAGCATPQSDTSAPYPTAVVDLDTFFIIQSRAAWLPPYPKNPNSTIHGVDSDGDCVRDDIEHYIAKKYRGKGQYKLRKYLYEYAAWMDRYLISGLSVNTAKTSFNNMAAAGECISRIIGDKETVDAADDLFAKFHNTISRSKRYIENLRQTAGWTTREKITVSCP